YPDANNLAHAQKGFFPVRIPVSHWQLRHYISTPEPDLLYYASAHDIYCLNTKTRKRKHIATLPFEARCTASGYGWVCVGGEDDGHFAAIKLDGSGARTLDVDAALPVEAWRQSTSSTGRRAASVKVERIGEEIVNSISIHRIQDEEAHLDDIVAVLTNNDKTVRVYSLPQSLETTVLDLPFAMNHATISPDGHTLVAVGDFNQAYFFQSQLQDVPPQIPKPYNRLTSSSIDWTLTSVVNLHASDTTSGYFTTAWSESGQLVAVGSEGGYVTVFNMEMLTSPDYDDEDAVVAVVPGSRPELLSYPGAVRTMMFAPDPWDLLIWAEDQGRVCIGDLRTGLKTKQVVDLVPGDQNLSKLVFEDLPREGTTVVPERPTRGIPELEQDFLRRYRQAPDNATAVNFATEYIEARRRQRQQRQDRAALRSVANSVGVDALEDDPQGLTVREQQILESLRTTRQREEARNSSGHIPRSVNYTTPDMFCTSSRTSSSSTPHALDSATARTLLDNVNRGVQVPDSFPELSRASAASARPLSSHDTTSRTHTLPSLDEIQDVVAGRRTASSLMRGMGEAPSRLPRRRASVVMPPPSTSTAPSRSVQPAPMPGTHGDDEDNPWRTIEEHMTLARGPLFESAARADAGPPIPASTSPRPTEEELAVEVLAERTRARTLARQRDRYRGLLRNDATAAAEQQQARAAIAGFQEGYETLLRRSQMRGAAGPMAAMSVGREVGVRTAGLAMSQDGRTLWVACEEGIFEVEVNVKGRMFWPGIDMR
ncbi:hypothetical protein LTR53_016568, partial [Teratosphaeriaceae sp. CCFEE 6253]